MTLLYVFQIDIATRRSIPRFHYPSVRSRCSTSAIACCNQTWQTWLAGKYFITWRKVSMKKSSILINIGFSVATFDYRMVSQEWVTSELSILGSKLAVIHVMA